MDTRTTGDMDVDVPSNEDAPRIAEKLPAVGPVSAPTFELDEYVTRYNGGIICERLEYIAKVCPPLRRSAIDLALSYASQRRNSTLFRHFSQLALDEGLISSVDAERANEIEKHVLVEARELEDQLRQATNHEPAKLADAFEALIEFHEQLGNYGQALRYLSRKAENIQGLSRSAEYVGRQGKLSLGSKSYTFIRSVTAKIVSEKHTDDASADVSAVYLLAGLSFLHSKQYEHALGSFLSIPVGAEQLSKLNSIASSTDIAMYTALCGLATMSRQDLKFLAYKDVVFVSFCEEAQYIRQLVQAFASFDLSKFFSLWKEHESDFKLEMYLGSHVSKLYKLIRSKAMNSVLDAYSKVDITSMAKIFNCTPDELVDELKQLIFDSELDARIDIAKGIVFHKQQESAQAIYEQSQQLATAFCRDGKLLLWSVETAQS